MLNRLSELNQYSVRSLAKRLLEAHERGYWNPNEEVFEKLREIVAALDVKVNRATV